MVWWFGTYLDGRRVNDDHRVRLFAQSGYICRIKFMAIDVLYLHGFVNVGVGREQVDDVPQWPI